jgi:hypothetical protein
VESVLHRPRRARRWLAPALVAAAGLLLALGVQRGAERREESLWTELSARSRRVAALEDTLSVMRQANRVLQASIEMNGQKGGLVIFADERTHRWKVVVHGLPPAPAGERYQFWFICADGMVRGAEVRADAGGPVLFTTGMPAEGGEVMGAALTIEPVTATAGPPRGRELAHLML